MRFELESAMDVLRRTPATLRVLLDGVAEPWARGTEGADTFSPFDVVGHLIDGEETDWIPRARIILARIHIFHQRYEQAEAEMERAIAINPNDAHGLAGRGNVLIRGRRAPIVGSVCMDMLMADVTGLGVSPGDEVVIVGPQGDDRIDVREMAAQIGTIPYEILCRIGSRIERVYG